MGLSASRKKINSQNPLQILTAHCEVPLFFRLSTRDEEIPGQFRKCRSLGVLLLYPV